MQTTEEYITKAKLIYGNEYDYSKTIYTGARKKIIIICPEHGEFEQYANLHLMGTDCPINTTNQLNSHLQRREGRKFIIKAIEKYGNLFDYSKIIYINRMTHVIISCPTHGDFKQAPSHHLSVDTVYGCTECNYDSKKYAVHDFIRIAKTIHGDKYDYSKVIYNNTISPIIITCKIHGDFEQIAKYHIKGVGCLQCLTPQYSQIAINWLDHMANHEGIYIQHAENGGEFNIPGSLYKADGYCAQTNTIFEYSGCYFHGCPRCYNPQEMNKMLNITFGERYQKTIKKEDLIKSLGYNLISIWGHEWPKKKPLPPKKIQLKLISQNSDMSPVIPKIEIILKKQLQIESK